MEDLFKYKVQVIDDAEENIDILVETLGEDYDVRVSMDGASALEDIFASPPDIILLDIVMPGMSGYEVCRQLKHNKKTADIPVIFVTVKQETVDQARGFKVGAVDYIIKPFSPPIIKARVQTHLKLKSQKDQLQESISIMEHEKEILLQKADLGIQAGCLAHDINNVLTQVFLVDIVPDMIPDELEAKPDIVRIVRSISDTVLLGKSVCKGYTNYIKDIGEGDYFESLELLLQPLDMYVRSFHGEIIKDIEDDLPPVKCKGYQLKRVFVNLFTNADQALENVEDKKIEIKLWADDDWVKFSMKDNGAGIPESIVPNIFDEMFSTKEDGVGLGLFLTKNVMDQHGGRIEVESVQNKGTMFTLSFPIIKDE
jgi:two-component system sensor histidine kinase/response regulator